MRASVEGARTAVIRIRIVQKPPIRTIDGVNLDRFAVGSEHELGDSLGDLFLAEGWAEPVPLDAPAPIVPFSDSDPFHREISNPSHLIRETLPRSLDTLATAADSQVRRRRR